MKVIATGQFTVYLASDEVTARLSCDIHGVPTDANGENSNYAGASTTLTIMDGSTDVTSKWNITYEEISVVGTFLGTTYTVTNLLEESAVVTFTARRSGYSDVVKQFKVIKSRQGITGADARNYYMNTDVSNIKQLRDGTFIPSNIEFDGKLRIGSKLPEDHSGYFVVYEQSRNAITVDDYTNLAQQGLIAQDSEYIVSDLAYPYVERYSSITAESHLVYEYKANPNMLLIEFYDDIDRQNILDIKTIPIVIDGSNAYNMYISPSDGIVFKFDKDNANIGISSTTLTATSTNIDNAKYAWEKDGVVVSGNTSNVLTVSYASLNLANSSSYRCTVSGVANGEDITLSDTVTVIKTKDGATGSPAYAISLVNDVVNISTDANGTGYDLSNARTGVLLYLGTTSKTGAIGTITASGCTATTDGTTMWLTGINTGVNDGYVDVQIKDGATVVGVKRFSFSKNKKGDKGDTGTSVSAIVEQYYLSTSATSLAGGSWSNSSPVWVDGKFIWTRSEVTYVNPSSVVTTSPVCVSGGKGTTGKGISSVDVMYYLSTSSTLQTGGTWATTAPAWTSGSFMWTKTKTTYTDTTTSESNPACITGATGAVGTSVSSIVEQYYLSTSNTAQAGGSWSTSVQAWVDGKYMWTRSEITYTNPSSVVTTSPVCVTGAKGGIGGTGVGISAVDVFYYLSTSSTAQLGGTWSTTAPAWVDGSFMWSKTKTTYTDATTDESSPVCITGATGSIGSAGRSVASMTEQYYLSTSSTAQSGGAWGTTVPAWVNGKYMWTRTEVVYSNPSSTVTTSPVCVSGGVGATGKGITSVDVWYYLSTSSTAQADGIWSTTAPAWVDGKYMWTKTKTTYTDTTSVESTPVCITGAKGSIGSAGRSVTSVIEEYYHSTSSTAQADGSWGTTVPAWVDGKYVWTRTKTTFSDSATSTTNPVCTTGSKGANGTTYYNWLKYADNADGTIGFADSPSGKRYFGIAMNQTSSIEGINPALYTWSPLYDNVIVGGRNLILKSDLVVNSSAYLVKVYTMSESFITGETYTVSIKGTVNSGQSFGVWQNGGVTGKGNLIYNATRGIHTLTFQASATTAGNEMVISVYNVASGTATSANIEWIQLEKGNINTTYTQAPEDIIDVIVGIDGRVKNAESAITEDAITNTVMGTTKFSAKLAEYAKGDELSNYATTEELGSVKNTADSAKKAIDGLDLKPYVTATQIAQLENSINSRVSQSGGINMLRNSIGWSGIDFWTIVTGAPITTQTPQLETFGFGSGWHKKHGTTATKITQTVNLPLAGTYTISFKMNKNTETIVAGKYSACGIYVDNLPFYGKATGSGVTSGFEDFSFTFTTTKLTADISIVIGELSEATISGVMLNLGSFPLQWTSHGSEIYNTNVRVDISGIQVMGNRSGKRTVINTTEFAGYENNEKVFTVNGDTTEVKKLKAEMQFAMAPITIITIDNASYQGWAYI